MQNFSESGDLERWMMEGWMGGLMEGWEEDPFQIDEFSDQHSSSLPSPHPSLEQPKHSVGLPVFTRPPSAHQNISSIPSEAKETLNDASDTPQSTTKEASETSNEDGGGSRKRPISKRRPSQSRSKKARLTGEDHGGDVPALDRTLSSSSQPFSSSSSSSSRGHDSRRDEGRQSPTNCSPDSSSPSSAGNPLTLHFTTLKKRAMMVASDKQPQPKQHSLKNSRLKWDPPLHQLFVDVINSLGMKHATPKAILKAMAVPGLTRENIASHLQKYIARLKKETDSEKVEVEVAAESQDEANVDGEGDADVDADLEIDSGLLPSMMEHFPGSNLDEDNDIDGWLRQQSS
mmetsp:Transcript_30595/g.49518  ORF Transcript_30595/g.49518 Transcript_30595/m.49518 type:complete len:345 (-) Transcript_30595:718-1752(-)